jgi:protein O-GlcNAc transferase
MTIDEAMKQAIDHHRDGRMAEAERLYRAILAAAPQHSDANHNLGLIALHVGKAEAALPLFGAAIAARPDISMYHVSLGNALQSLGRADEAEASYRQAVRVNPNMVEGPYNLGVMLKDRGKLAEAEACFRQTITLRPTLAAAYNNLGIVLNGLNRLNEAAESFRQALKLEPNDAKTGMNLANVMMGLGALDDAALQYGRVLALAPDLPEAHSNMGLLQRDLGQAETAMFHFRRALDLNPGSQAAHRNLLLSILYQPAWTPDQRFAEHRRFEAQHAQPLYPQAVAFTNVRDSGRRLRIGYLSSDFRSHPVGRNLLPLIEAHDRSKVELAFYAYLDNPDSVTARFQALADLWRPVFGLEDNRIADLIRADSIDVLVVLAGRFDRNRPLVAAYRPAPVQINFHDAATSGLSVMDAIITDRVMTPRHGTELFTERPLRLPSFYLHDPIAEAPPVAPPPMLKNGYPTFGSFNRPSKLSNDALALWAEVLRAIPEARLRLKYKTWFATPSLARRVLDIMAGHGVASERIDLSAEGGDIATHLSHYDAIDIALDPFPFTGSTTTFEALWMGVPVVTLPGETMVSRWSASMLGAIKLDQDTVAEDPADFVELCRRLCADPARLAGLRAGLRDRVAASPLCDARLKARHLERAYGALWRRWCRADHQSQAS